MEFIGTLLFSESHPLKSNSRKPLASATPCLRVHSVVREKASYTMQIWGRRGDSPSISALARQSGRCNNKFIFFAKTGLRAHIPTPFAPMPTVLSIAGFDPSSGAGITADLMVFAAHGLFGTSAITALTVQSTVGVRSSHPVQAGLLADTLAFLDEDLPPAGIKIGMLGTAANVAAVCDYLEEVRARERQDSRSRTIVVLDPVLRSTSGRELLEPGGIDVLRTRLLPLVDWVTPNIDELAILTGSPVTKHEHLLPAARTVQRQSAAGRRAFAGRSDVQARLGVLATGGHLLPPNDLLVPPVAPPPCEPCWLPGEFLASSATHGTGCAHSSAFLSSLVLGKQPLEAARCAKRYVVQALQAGASKASEEDRLQCESKLSSTTT